MKLFCFFLSNRIRKPRLLTSVVAIRVPPSFDSVDQITSLFRSYGEIGLVRLLRPGKEVPSDLRNYATQVPDIGDSLCAVVDFEGSDAALKAVRELKEQFRPDSKVFFEIFKLSELSSFGLFF